MKKNIVVLISFVVFLLVGCSDSNLKIGEINPEQWLAENGVSIEESFSSQVEQTQYLIDLEDFVSYNILSVTENKPYNSEISMDVDFDEDSSVQGGLDFYQKKYSKSYDNEKRDIEFSVKANGINDSSEPFDLSGSVSLLHQDDEMYANLHDLEVFMGEGNMAAKMYKLLGDLLVDNWVNLEIHSGGIISLDENEDKKLPYILSTIKNVLKTEDIQTSPNFLGSVAELVDTINSYIDLGISTNELSLVSHEISYYKLSDKSIQKSFTGLFQGKESAFDLSFIVSKKGMEAHICNIKEYDEDVSDYKDIELEFSLSLKEGDKSEYSIKFESIKSQKKVADIQGIIRYGKSVDILADFVMEPLEIVAGQKISGKLEGNITKISGESDVELPELTGEILLLSELLSSL